MKFEYGCKGKYWTREAESLAERSKMLSQSLFSQTIWLLSNFNAIIFHQSQQKPNVEKYLSQKDLWVWILANRVNIKKSCRRTTKFLRELCQPWLSSSVDWNVAPIYLPRL